MRIYDDETIEDLQINGYRLIQKKHGFRYGMDSVLLADFADVGKNDFVADFGTGSGVLPILLLARGKGKRYLAIEIQREMAELARRNVELNGLNEKISVLNQDASQAHEFINSCTMDAVVCNPPYWTDKASLSSPDPGKSVSRNINEKTLSEIFTSAFRILKGKGKLFLIYPAPQMLKIMRVLQSCHLEPKRFRLVYPSLNKPANLVLIEAVKDAKPMLHPMPAMVIYDEKGNLTNELKSVYHIEKE